MNNKKGKRKINDIILEILEFFVLNRDIRKTKMMYSVNLSSEQMQKYFEPIVKQGFIIENLNQQFNITKKGLEFYKSLLEEKLYAKVQRIFLKKWGYLEK